MIVTFREKKKVCFDVKTLECDVVPRFFEDAEIIINGCSSDDDENSPKMPAMRVEGEDIHWCPIIRVNDGRILNWKEGVSAKIHYKVCDEGTYTIVGDFCGGDVEYMVQSYVPDCLSIGENGYGDYIIMEIDNDGYIQDWKFGNEEVIDLLQGDFNRGSDFEEYEGC